MSAKSNARLVACGSVLVVGAALLAAVGGQQTTVVFGVAMGAGICTSTRLVTRSPRTHATLLVAIFVAFVAYRVGTIVTAAGAELATTTPTPARVVGLVLQTAALAVTFALVYEHAHGVAQVASLFGDTDAGYAVVLDERSAARTVEAELARSRRNATSLAFILLEREGVAHSHPVGDLLGRCLSARAIDELEQLFTSRRLCTLVAQQVRRSDIVVCAAGDRFLVISIDTTDVSTRAVVTRIADSARSELGVTLRSGAALFPHDGTTYGELLDVAVGAARSVVAVAPIDGAGRTEPTGALGAVELPAPLSDVQATP
jgi:hypothetical protein